MNVTIHRKRTKITRVDLYHRQIIIRQIDAEFICKHTQSASRNDLIPFHLSSIHIDLFGFGFICNVFGNTFHT